MTIHKDKCPFPWFGGKQHAAPTVWRALGDVGHYVEPFAGSLATLLLRPHTPNRSYHSETVNDLDGMLCNFWRAIQHSPDATADAASWPVSEADLHARHLALLRWREERQLEHLMGDPAFHDPVMAGWWAWGQSSWIGSGWCSGQGPWVVDDDGRIVKRGKPGVHRKRPHIGDNGQGVNHAGTREPGVHRKRPHLANNGQGVNHAGTREPGVKRSRPHLADDGRGVNRPQAREPGVKRNRPHIDDDGRGVNHAGTREPGVCDEAREWHPMAMPELREWFRFLSARLRHVRILNGDWKRACTDGAMKTIGVRAGKQHAGVFLDPPYLGSVRTEGLYAHDDHAIADEVRAWAIKKGGDKSLRIVLAGFDEEHRELETQGWRVVEWFANGFLTGGMGNVGDGGQQKRERLWLSPACLDDVVVPAKPITGDLFAWAAS